MPSHQLQSPPSWTATEVAPTASASADRYLPPRLQGVERPGHGAGVSRSLASLAVLLLFAFTAADRAAAADQPQPTEPDPPYAEALAADEGLSLQLSGGTFDQRQRAMWELWRDRAANREAVSTAVHDPDPEVSSRAQWIMDRWRRGILPETPLELARQLEATSHSDSLQRLLDAGLFSGARVVIEEAVLAKDQATLQRAQAVVQRGFVFYVRRADAQQQLQELMALVERLASTAEMLICRNQLAESLGHDSAVETATALPIEDPLERQRIGVIALAAGDRLDEATQLAEQAADPELLRVCQLLRRDWPQLAQSQSQAAAEAAAGSAESDRHWAYCLVAASRAGDRELREQAVAALSLRPSDQAADAAEDPFVRLRWQVLAMHGEINAAVEILAPSQPLVAAELLAQAGRLAEAMETIGFAPEETDARLGELIAAARSAAESWTTTQRREIPEPLERLLATARLLYLSGRRDAAWELFAGVTAAGTEAETASLALPRALALQALMRLNRPDWLTRMILQDEGPTLSGTSRHFLSRALAVQPETIDALVVSLSQLLPGSGNELPRAVVDLLDGELPPNFDPHQDYQRLFLLLSGASPAVVRRDERWSSSAELPQLNLEIAKLFEAHGQLELAKKSLIHLASRGEIEAILELAETELKEGRVQAARELFAAVWKRIDQQRQDPARLNRAEDDALAALRAILGEAVAAARMGDQEGADQLWHLIDLMLCSPSAKLRVLFGSHLLDQGFDQQAEEIFRVLVPWVAFGSDEGVEFYAVARNFNRALAASQPALAADVFDLAIAGTIESTVFYPAAYISLPAYVHRKKILAALPHGDHGEIRGHVEAVMRLNPIDIDFGEKVVEQLRQAGMAALAEETLERIYRSGSEHLQRFPLDVVTANNLAWILARSDYRLEDALELSRRCVYFTPDSTVYRDTLAEVLFRLGRVEQAIAIEKACLLDQPSEWHMHEQLRRFEAARRD